MASTDKTPKLGLNQWAAGDRVLRTDFNADNAKIEAGIEAAKAAAAVAATAAANAVVKIVSGSFVGDNTAPREIAVGFRPNLVIFCSANSRRALKIFSAENCLSVSEGGSPCGEMTSTSSLDITDNGFLIRTDYYNATGHIGYYIAFG
ncbi:MAG: hypothetical protein RSG86_08140 [Oscillospiraceae bacterium]